MSENEYRNAIVLVLDGLSANQLGAFGNTCIETPNLNRLAAESILFDQAFTNSTELESAYNNLFDRPGGNLVENLGNAGISSVLISDEPDVHTLPATKHFERAIEISPPKTTELAKSVSETEMANFFAQAVEWITNSERGSFGWLHARALFGDWDAPYEMRKGLADSEDPDPPTFFKTPAHLFSAGFDPDELLGFQQACNAQVVLIDQFHRRIAGRHGDVRNV